MFQVVPAREAVQRSVLPLFTSLPSPEGLPVVRGPKPTLVFSVKVSAISVSNITFSSTEHWSLHFHFLAAPPGCVIAVRLESNQGGEHGENSSNVHLN